MTADCHWTLPTYDDPVIPTLPSHHGWLPIHSIVSNPSLNSLTQA